MLNKTKKQKISIIVAMAKNRVIGKNGEIPWNIPGEKKRFKELTWNKTIIMGRKTFDSIGRVLPNRNTIVISRNSDLKIEGCLVVDSMEKALENCVNDEEIFIAGGGEIYRMFLPLTEKIYLTVIDEDFDGDITFLEINNDFEEIYLEKIDGDISYSNKTFVRKK